MSKDRKLFIVGNPAAGKKKLGETIRQLSDYIQSRELSYEIHDTAQTRSAARTVAEEMDGSYTDLVIVGGDGTINESINGLKHDVPISIIPAGTGDDFAKNIDLGKSREDHFATAIDGDIRQIDLGKCNDRKFANGIGIGFDGQIVEDMVAKRVRLLKGHAAYYYHVLRILGSYRERPFGYEMDGKTIEKELILLTIGNGTTFGGGFRLMPDAKIDDGWLDICEIGKLSPLRRFLNIHRLSKGSHVELDVVNSYQAQQIVVKENPLVYAHIDGERLGQPPFHITILPGSLRLRCRK